MTQSTVKPLNRRLNSASNITPNTTSNNVLSNKTTLKATHHKTLHPRNLHNNGYAFDALIKTTPVLAQYVSKNIYGNLSIDFSNPDAVIALNTSLLAHHYQILHWQLPKGALCPPIPGRVDYIHHIADLLAADQNQHPNKHPSKNQSIRLLDIGTGASGIYPLLACQIYQWHCVGSDINPDSIANITTFLNHNPSIKKRFELRHQPNKHNIFQGVIKPNENFDVTVCNPPFHASQADAIKGSQRKVNNLTSDSRSGSSSNANRNISRASQKHTQSNQSNQSPTLNFGGQADELWCNGGEALFLKKMIKESQQFSSQCRWFTSLISKSDNLKPAQKQLHKLKATQVKIIPMHQGNKITRILAWQF